MLSVLFCRSINTCKFVTRKIVTELHNEFCVGRVVNTPHFGDLCEYICKIRLIKYTFSLLKLHVIWLIDNPFQGGDDKETRERPASLVVLPPLVLGYEELYVDNDDNQPAKKDMDYPNENEEKKGTKGTTPKDEIETEEVATEKTKETVKETTKKEEKQDKKVEEKKDKKKETTTQKKDKQKEKEPKKDKKKKDDKKTTKKDTKKDDKKKSAKNNKKDKKKDKGKKKGKRKGKVESSLSRSESNSESSGDSSDENQSQSGLSNDYDTLELIDLQELLNNQPSVYGVERIYPTFPTRPGKMTTRSYNNLNLDLGLSNQGFTSNKGMILKNRISKQVPLINDKTYVRGLNLKPTTSSLNKIMSLLSRRSSKSSGDKKPELRSDDKGVITLKGQGEIGEGKEVLEFTGNFRVPKKVLDCPCFKEILQKEKPSFKSEEWRTTFSTYRLSASNWNKLKIILFFFIIKTKCFF